MGMRVSSKDARVRGRYGSSAGRRMVWIQVLWRGDWVGGEGGRGDKELNTSLSCCVWDLRVRGMVAWGMYTGYREIC
jgi:hypothetical protein